MQWTEGNDATQNERRPSDLSALLFEITLFVLIVLLLSFTAHAQQLPVTNQRVVVNAEGLAQGNFLGTVHAEQTPAPQNKEQKPQPQSTLQPQTKTHTILVSVSHRKLALLEDGKVMRMYTIAVGKKSTPTPAGQFFVAARVSKPVWSHKGKVVQPGPENPVGSRWIGLNVKGYGIHGTNVPDSIGQAASHGCVRMGKKDIEELFALVNIGDEVDIRTVVDDEVAAIFDPQPAATLLQASAANATNQVSGQ